jgi:hypothetical protein
MPHAEVIRRTLLRLTHASDEDVAGYILDAYEIRVHPKHVAAIRSPARPTRSPSANGPLQPAVAR